MLDRWPFEDPPDRSVITLRAIVERGSPILFVVHDAGDDGWQFLDGGTPRLEDARIVSFHVLAMRDRSLHALARLPTGWEAWRDSPAGAWHWRRSRG